mmetsp:Transcript_33202/g.65167  ORF Transcript_33202/g.65167 Transcript_33202/m.65167 type:complete len:199 (-) Transcript_33202:85-681(-)
MSCSAVPAVMAGLSFCSSLQCPAATKAPTRLVTKSPTAAAPTNVQLAACATKTSCSACVAHKAGSSSAGAACVWSVSSTGAGQCFAACNVATNNPTLCSSTCPATTSPTTPTASPTTPTSSPTAPSSAPTLKPTNSPTASPTLPCNALTSCSVCTQQNIASIRCTWVYAAGTTPACKAAVCIIPQCTHQAANCPAPAG